eukprot:TRINITY_DN11082_c0_g1_i1.p1 TRINITY_DN11082_c0_g1~~TRINITY_DN11082_c0_g1_i1.p1  ORF type:complete len:343 (+),score=88.01 TRINITY_DN11082_c0_g1_i1:17-1045(+)
MKSYFTNISFLGTASGAPSKKRNVSSYCVSLQDSRQILLDCGEGTQHQILRSKYVKNQKLVLILITHLHGDHSFGLPGLLASLSLTATSTVKRTVVGPAGIKKYLETCIKLSDTYLTFPLDIIELEPEKVHDLGVIEGLKITAAPLKHKVASFGFVVEESEKPKSLNAKKASEIAGCKLDGKIFSQLKDGKDVVLENGVTIHSKDVLDQKPSKKILLLGDTCDSSRIEEFSLNVDLVVHESTLDSKQEEKAINNGHSTPKMAGIFALKIKAKNMILTHFSQRYDSEENNNGMSVEDLRKEAEEICGKELSVYAANDFDTFSFTDNGIELVKEKIDKKNEKIN